MFGMNIQKNIWKQQWKFLTIVSKIGLIYLFTGCIQPAYKGAIYNS